MALSPPAYPWVARRECRRLMSFFLSMAYLLYHGFIYCCMVLKSFLLI